MTIAEIIALSVGLALDALAVSFAASCSGKLSKGGWFRLSFHFGLFQFMMPVIGWLIGGFIVTYVTKFDHWIAFLLLGFIGSKMIYESFGNKEDSLKSDPSKGISLVLLSVATSIDALMVGFSLALINLNIWFPAIMIGIITTIISLSGLYLAGKLKNNISNKAEFLGGAIIILIGIKILIEHLFYL